MKTTLKTTLAAVAFSILLISAASAQSFYAGPDGRYLAEYGVSNGMNYPFQAAHRSNLNPRDPAYTGGDAGGDEYYPDQTMWSAR
jgi:hypothetical protein